MSAVTDLLVQSRLIDVPMAGLYPVPIAWANELLVTWGHKLGPVHRPFTQVAYSLEIAGEVVAVAVSGSAVSATVAGYTRGQVVELTRLCAVPGNSWVNRVMLRLWREVCAPTWPDWRPLAAISYSHNALHAGSLYRLDGWRCVATDCGSAGGGAWSRKRYATDAVAGKKSLWVWAYPEKTEATG
jgi:hypothetical protein